MRVLVLESTPGTGQGASDALTEAGHDVLRCHTGDEAFPCVGLSDHECPVAEGIDVTVAVRDEGTFVPTEFEDGVRCSIRAGVPLVVAGPAASNPFEPWTRAHADGDGVVGAVERVAAEPDPRLTNIATARLCQFLERRGLDCVGATVHVHRGAEGLVAELALPDPDDTRLGSSAAVRVLAALTEAGVTQPVSVRLIGLDRAG